MSELSRAWQVLLFALRGGTEDAINRWAGLEAKFNRIDALGVDRDDAIEMATNAALAGLTPEQHRQIIIDWHHDRYYDPTPIESGWKRDVRKIRAILNEQKAEEGDDND